MGYHLAFWIANRLNEEPFICIFIKFDEIINGLLIREPENSLISNAPNSWIDGWTISSIYSKFKYVINILSISHPEKPILNEFHSECLNICYFLEVLVVFLRFLDLISTVVRFPYYLHCFLFRFFFLF